MEIAELGRRHLRDALTGRMKHCEVSEWLDDDGQPVKVYWRPLTGEQQKQVEGFDGVVERTCMMLKVRALDADGRRIFADTPIESLVHDYDFNVLRAIVFLMTTDTGQNTDEGDDIVEQLEKE